MMIHKLTHASQVRRLEIEKGTRWVAEYWSINAKKQLNNTIFKGGNPYGNKGDNCWEQTALSDGGILWSGLWQGIFSGGKKH